MHCDTTTFDPELLITKLDGDEDLARELLRAFIEDAPVRLQGLDRAIAESDAEEATDMSHSLKGMCGVIRVQRLVDMALAMEQAGRTGRLERIQEVFVPFSDCLEAVLGQIRTYLD